MAEHITQWLGAYLDGELHGTRLHQVEHHLSECAECQAELDGMMGLSALLRETPPEGDFLSTERFVSNLTLNLPRQPEQAQPRNWLEIGWWMIPVGLLGTWLFIQITFSLSSVALAAVDAGLLGGDLSWLRGSPAQMEWYVTATNLFGNQLGFPGRKILSMANDAQVFIAHVTGSLIPQAILAVAYLGWLFSWWMKYHQRQSSQNPGNFSRS